MPFVVLINAVWYARNKQKGVAPPQTSEPAGCDHGYRQVLGT